jgi:hypothetical protein
LFVKYVYQLQTSFHDVNDDDELLDKMNLVMIMEVENSIHHHHYFQY